MENKIQDAKQRILNSTVALFSSKGYAETSVREIARDAGVNLSMISYYFNGKEGILLHIVNSVVENFKRFTDNIDLSNTASVFKLLKDILTYVFQHREEIKIAYMEVAKNHEGLLPVEEMNVLQKKLKAVMYKSISGEIKEDHELQFQVFINIVTDLIFADCFIDYFNIQGNLSARQKEKMRNLRIRMILDIMSFIVKEEGGSIRFDPRLFH